MRMLFVLPLAMFLTASFAKSPQELCIEAVEKKTDELFAECIKVADNVDGDTQYLISDLYSLGLYAPYKRNTADGKISGLQPPNDKLAFQWMVKAASNKIPSQTAAFVLAQKYRLGSDGVSRDYIAAIKFYKTASKLGSYIASSQLAAMHRNGQGVEIDLLKTYIFNNIALAQSRGDAHYAILLKNELNELESKLTKSQILTAQSASSDCLQSNFSKCSVY